MIYTIYNIYIFKKILYNFFFFKTQKQQSEVFFKIALLKNFTKFAGKHLCQNLFLNKVPTWGLQLN